MHIFAAADASVFAAAVATRAWAGRVGAVPPGYSSSSGQLKYWTQERTTCVDWWCGP